MLCELLRNSPNVHPRAQQYMVIIQHPQLSLRSYLYRRGPGKFIADSVASSIVWNVNTSSLNNTTLNSSLPSRTEQKTPTVVRKRESLNNETTGNTVSLPRAAFHSWASASGQGWVLWGSSCTAPRPYLQRAEKSFSRYPLNYQSQTSTWIFLWTYSVIDTKKKDRCNSDNRNAKAIDLNRITPLEQKI